MQRCSAASNELQANKTQQNRNAEQKSTESARDKSATPKKADDRPIKATTKLQEVGNLKAKRFGQLAPHRSSERSRSNATHAMRCTMRCNARIVNAVTEHAEREMNTNTSDEGAISKNRDGARHMKADEACYGAGAP